MARFGSRRLSVFQGGKRFREFVQETGGKAQIPYLIDENTGVKMYESDDIVSIYAKTADLGRIKCSR